MLLTLAFATPHSVPFSPLLIYAHESAQVSEVQSICPECKLELQKPEQPKKTEPSSKEFHVSIIHVGRFHLHKTQG